jgi:hypothetical protein
MNDKLVTMSCIAGFFGDASLQVLTKKFGMGGSTGWGLKPYFSQHGTGEALCVATGMMALFYILFLYVLRLPPVWYYLAIYGIVLDFIFRKLRLFTSLDGYYKSLNYFWSAFWGAIPMVLPLFMYKVYLTSLKL